MSNKLNAYLESGELVGLDKFLRLQRVSDGYIATKFGITSLAPMGFAFGLLRGGPLFLNTNP